jgi:hypothetical protein
VETITAAIVSSSPDSFDPTVAWQVIIGVGIALLGAILMGRRRRPEEGIAEAEIGVDVAFSRWEDDIYGVSVEMMEPPDDWLARGELFARWSKSDHGNSSR